MIIRAPLRAFRDQLEGRSMLVRRCRMEPIECVARGYVSGSGWKDYQKTGAICGIPLPGGLRESDQLPEPIFTPATKAETGHDENIPFEKALQHRGPPDCRTAAGSHPAHLCRRFAARRNPRHYSRRHQVRIRLARRTHPARRRSPDARFLALLAARRILARQPRRSPSTNNSCAIIWKRSTGTNSLPPRRCRTT